MNQTTFRPKRPTSLSLENICCPDFGPTDFRKNEKNELILRHSKSVSADLRYQNFTPRKMEYILYFSITLKQIGDVRVWACQCPFISNQNSTNRISKSVSCTQLEVSLSRQFRGDHILSLYPCMLVPFQQQPKFQNQ